MSQQYSDFWASQTVSDVVRAARTRSLASPSPAQPLPDLVSQPAVESEATKAKGVKRALSEIQLEHLNKGAFFFDFEEPAVGWDGMPVDNEGTARKVGVKQFREMEEKGFRVTKDGCIMPQERYGIRGQGASLKGHQRSCFFFVNATPIRATENQRVGKPSKGGSGKVVRDSDGWPTDTQYSHLCHRSWCINPLHGQLEPRPANLRRNWCGILGTDGCDCGMVPPCLRKYHPTEWEDTDVAFCETANEVHTALAGLKLKFNFTLKDSKRVRAQATKAHNAFLRKRKGHKAKAAEAKCHSPAAKRARSSSNVPPS